MKAAVTDNTKVKKEKGTPSYLPLKETKKSMLQNKKIITDHFLKIISPLNSNIA